MAALVKYADSDSTKDPESDDEKPGKGRRTTAPKVSSITGQAMVVEASGKRMVTWTLWLIPARRTTASDARVNRKITVGHPTLTRRIKEVINVRLTSLWLTLVHRATTNGARGGHLLGQAGQVPPLSNY